MSEYSSYTSPSQSLSRSRELPFRYPDDIIRDPDRWDSRPRRDSELEHSWVNVPAPIPPTTLPYHHKVTPPASRSRLSQPSTPPNRYAQALPQRYASAPMVPSLTRIDYPASPSSRPSSSGHESRRQPRRGSTRGSPKQRRYPWPPSGYTSKSILSHDEALDLIVHGALVFEGKTSEIPNTDGTAHRFYASVVSSSGTFNAVSKREQFQDSAFGDMSLSLMGEGLDPAGSLEYPNTLYAFGKSPGTTTITWFAGQRGDLRTPTAYGSRAKPRKMKLITILDRLRQLEEKGLLDEHPEVQYNHLYEKLIEDPEQLTNPHYDCAFQIIDLMNVLSNSEWIDFSLPKNQVVAKFFDSQDEKVKARFFHQLLLAVELYLRMNDSTHFEDAKRAIFQQLPPKVLWDMALAQRWLENMSIERLMISEAESQCNFILISKKRQKDALRHFARLLKWPNMEEVEYVLEERDERAPVEERTADTMSWFTGVVLPGPTLPFLLMNTLIDCDEDTDGQLGALTHVRPNCGFQYRGNTYWSYKSILGKVLGASRGVKAVGGWVGPCHYTPDLARTQCAIVKAKPPPKEKSDAKLNKVDVEDMSHRSDPLGMGDEHEFHIRDFNLPLPPEPDSSEDIIRIQKLAFRETSDEKVKPHKGSRSYDAAVVFAFAESNMPIRLKYDVDFIFAASCDMGPHPLWNGYRTRTVRVEDGLIHLPGWGFGAGKTPIGRRALALRETSIVRRLRQEDEYYSSDYERDWDDHEGYHNSPGRRLALPPITSSDECALETLIVEACGVSDNEVFARAWCSYWGVHAVVANTRETCIACAVREARAAGVDIVILTDGGREGEHDQGVWDLLSQVG